MLTAGWPEPPCSHPGLQRSYYLHAAPVRVALAARAWEIHDEHPDWPAADCWSAALDEVTMPGGASC